MRTNPVAGKLLLEQELRRSCVLTDQSQIDEVTALVMDLILQGLLGGNVAGEHVPSLARSSCEVNDGRVIYCQPRYNGGGTRTKFLVRFEDAEVRDRVFEDETEARAFFEGAIENWNCYLFALLER